MDINPKLSIAEVQDRYDREWVLLENPQLSDSLDVKGGTVLCHSKSQDEVYEQARKLAPQHSAILYVGELPENAAVVI